MKSFCCENLLMNVFKYIYTMSIVVHFKKNDLLSQTFPLLILGARSKEGLEISSWFICDILQKVRGRE